MVRVDRTNWTGGWALPAALAMVLLGTVVARGEDPDPAATNPARDNAELASFFQNEVLPVLQSKCFRCHGAEQEIQGGLTLTSRTAVLAGGDSGVAIDVEDPSASLLLEAINYESYEMPPTGQLPPQQIEILTRWVRSGVPWTPGKESEPIVKPAHHGPPQVNAETKNHWAFRPLVRPAVPLVPANDWVRGPIDAYIWHGLNEAGLSPADAADQTALLRRAYYDLIGLPPTPDEVDEFLHDKSPDAFERVIDRLLDSPQYGERWGRHWLDLVRYAETNSYERDGEKPFVWRYRDYVIDAFNQDKPYDQFIIEQLAGDELQPRTSQRLIATGYYRLGIWDDEPVDPKQALYDDLDDILATTSQVFLGLTLNCARCHDHKLDPIPQRDYYRMLAFFSGLNRFGIRSAETVANYSLRPIATAEELARQAEEVAAHQRQQEEIDRRLAEIEEIVKKDFAPVEFEEFKHEQNRVALVKKRVPEILTKQQFEQYAELTKEKKQLSKFKPSALSQALCVTEIGDTPRDMFVLARGNPHAEGDPVQPGFPEVLSPPEPLPASPPPSGESSGRRSSLAAWIASPENPLTARVMANRVWQYHFGRAIARSTNNLGLQGDPPTHPALLDYLACELIDGGWRLKPLHKQIMLSSAYQMSSRANETGLAQDPENNLFWRFDMRRLEAEEVRDSILAVNGSLNLTMGGPSIYPIIPPEVLAGQSRPGSGWGESSAADRARRSVYIHVKRSLLVPVVAAFDSADVDASCPVRFSTTQPTQALLLMNSEFANRQAQVFARYLQSQDDSTEGRVTRALERAFQRTPTSEEVQRGIGFIESLRTRHQLDEQQALNTFCLMVLNLNEFVYLD